MKPKGYVQKYELIQAESFNHDEFFSDLSQDFFSVIEYLQSAKQLNYSRFKVEITSFRQKFDSIKAQSKISADVWTSIWNKFATSVLAVSENKLFGAYLQKEKEKKQRREREEKSYLNQFRGNPRDFFSEFEDFAQFFLRGLMLSSVPTSSFSELELPVSSTSEEIKDKFKKLALIHHPDCGGSQQKMVQIIEAKNKCLAYTSSQNPKAI